MRTNALMVAFMSTSPWLDTPESNNVSTEKCNLCCFCIYLYVQIQRIRCKNIYVNIYIYITSAISFLFFSLKTYEYIRKDSKSVGNPHQHPEEHVPFQKPYSQPSLFLPNVVSTRVSAFLRFVLHFIFFL